MRDNKVLLYFLFVTVLPRTQLVCTLGFLSTSMLLLRLTLGALGFSMACFMGHKDIWGKNRGVDGWDEAFHLSFAFSSPFISRQIWSPHQISVFFLGYLLLLA